MLLLSTNMKKLKNFSYIKQEIFQTEILGVTIIQEDQWGLVFNETNAPKYGNISGQMFCFDFTMYLNISPWNSTSLTSIPLSQKDPKFKSCVVLGIKNNLFSLQDFLNFQGRAGFLINQKIKRNSL